MYACKINVEVGVHINVKIGQEKSYKNNKNILLTENHKRRYMLIMTFFGNVYVEIQQKN